MRSTMILSILSELATAMDDASVDYTTPDGMECWQEYGRLTAALVSGSFVILRHDSALMVFLNQFHHESKVWDHITFD